MAAQLIHRLGAVTMALCVTAGCAVERSSYYADKGTALAQQGRHSEAIEAFRRAIELSPNWAAPQLEMGKSLWALQHRDEAIAAYRQALRMEPDSAEAKQLLEQALAALGTNGTPPVSPCHSRKAVGQIVGTVAAQWELVDGLAKPMRSFRQALSPRADRRFEQVVPASGTRQTHSVASWE